MDAACSSSSSSSSAGLTSRLVMSGVEVPFPSSKRPFPSQLSMMHAVISSCQKGQHALLEAPTGTGKTLALLLATMSWQRHEFAVRLASFEKEKAAAMERSAKRMAAAAAERQKISPPKIMQQQQQVQIEKEIVVTSRFFRNSDVSDPEQPNGMKRKREPGMAEIEDPLRKRRRNEDKNNGDDSDFETPNSKRAVNETELAKRRQVETTAPKSTKGNEPKLVAPVPTKIFYVSRTHSQLSQAIQELRSLPLESRTGPVGNRPIRMCVLGSRNQLCVNPKVIKKKENRNDECELLLKKLALGNPKGSCSFFTGQNRLKLKIDRIYSESVTKCSTNSAESAPHQGRESILDIEDLVELGTSLKGCPFFVSKELVHDANLVFCPYNYIFDSKLSACLAKLLDGAIVIIDEAHNIEDVCREAASCDLDLLGLIALREDLSSFFEGVGSTSKLLNLEASYPGSSEAVLQLFQFVSKFISFVESTDPVTWAGPEALAILEERCGLTKDAIESLTKSLQVLDREYQPNSQPDEALDTKSPVLVNLSHSRVESLLTCLNFMTSFENRFTRDFRFLIRPSEFVSASRSTATTTTTNRSEVAKTVSIWCMNPAVAFKSLDSRARSIVLTSGTLSPLSSFSSELGVSFPKTLEASHVIDPKKQVWIGTVSQGPTRVALDATFKNADSPQYIDELGQTILSLCKSIPDGVLCFFPSYAQLERCRQRWNKESIWNELQKVKSGGIFVEQGGKGHITTSTQHSQKEEEVFERIVSQFRKAVAAGSGALFFGVFRGKLSEGINFADRDARGVLVIGIPFPALLDPKIKLKKQYQDEKVKTGLTTLTGNQWYLQQAYRALNQALGRCIRHRNDYGAIALIDHRFDKSEHVSEISRWLRGSVKTSFQCFAEVIESVDHFFVSTVPSSLLLPPRKADPLTAETASARAGATQQDISAIEVIDDSPFVNGGSSHLTLAIPDPGSTQEDSSHHVSTQDESLTPPHTATPTLPNESNNLTNLSQSAILADKNVFFNSMTTTTTISVTSIHREDIFMVPSPPPPPLPSNNSNIPEAIIEWVSNASTSDLHKLSQLIATRTSELHVSPLP